MRNPGMPADIIEWIHIIYKGIPGYGGNSPFSTSPFAGMTEPCSAGMTEPCSAGMTEPCSAGMTEPCSAGMTEPCSAGMTESCSAGMTEWQVFQQQDIVSNHLIDINHNLY